MKIRALTLLGVLSGTGFAQQILPADRLIPVTVPTRSAGVFHVWDGTWTRKASVASIGADVIYNNSCDEPFHFALSGDTVVTNGRLPSPTSPKTPTSRPGCAHTYTVDGFEIAYCTTRPSPGVITIDFFNAYGCCGSVVGIPPTASFPLAGLPGSASGAQSCWSVTIDLDPADTFMLFADRDGTYEASPPYINGFGWSFRSSLTGVAASTTGPVIASAGACASCAPIDGTVWDSPIDYTESGVGMDTCPSVQVESGPTPPGCYVFGSCPDPNFHLRLIADACPFDGGNPGTGFCYGDGTGAPCPCGNISAPGWGCQNSLGFGAQLTATGTASITTGICFLNGIQMPPNSSALYFQGTIQQNSGAGAAFGDGKRCAAGTVHRLGIKTNSASGTSSYPEFGDPRIPVQGQLQFPTTRTYQVWYRNIAPFCTPAGFNLSNGVMITWGT